MSNQTAVDQLYEESQKTTKVNNLVNGKNASKSLIAVDGAILKCSQIYTSSILHIQSHGSQATGVFEAHDEDRVPGVNIVPFNDICPKIQTVCSPKPVEKWILTDEYGIITDSYKVIKDEIKQIKPLLKELEKSMSNISKKLPKIDSRKTEIEASIKIINDIKNQISKILDKNPTSVGEIEDLIKEVDDCLNNSKSEVDLICSKTNDINTSTKGGENALKNIDSRINEISDPIAIELQKIEDIKKCWDDNHKNGTHKENCQLTVNSVLPCTNGGLITIENSGQKFVNSIKLFPDYYEMMEKCYFYTHSQAEIIARAYIYTINYPVFQNESYYYKLRKFFENISGLCCTYSGASIRWQAVAGNAATADSIEFFISIGFTRQEMIDLYTVINLQQGFPSYYDSLAAGVCIKEHFKSVKKCPDLHKKEIKFHLFESQYYDEFFKKDDAKDDGLNLFANKGFSHEFIQYSVFTCNGLGHIVWNIANTFFLGGVGNINNLSGYKGDIYSTRYSLSDFNSDIDAPNVYNRFIQDQSKDFFEIMTKYNLDILNKNSNRVDEYLTNYGNGNMEKGLENLKKDLDNIDIATWYLLRGPSDFIKDFFVMSLMDSYNKRKW